MTAGAGLMHSEMPEKEFASAGGKFHGFQLWVNLPKRDKLIKPRYQDIPGKTIPVVVSRDGRVKARVIAGQALGTSAVIDTRTPILYVHFTLEPGADFTQTIPSDYNPFAYVIDGTGYFGVNEQQARPGQMVIFAKDGDKISIRAGSDSNKPLDLLLIGGAPLNEPIARYGPFVMNTEEEVYQAIEDYQSGRMGVIAF